ncbi:MAG: hypothetical protein AB4058_11250 [Microcystaceae cyanobacterium]
MIREQLAKEFTGLVKSYHPHAGKLLQYCHVRVIECYIERLHKTCYYFGMYCPQEMIANLKSHQNAYREIAENMGLMDAVIINADRLIRDPMSQLKHDNPRLWLEIYWVATQIFY